MGFKDCAVEAVYGLCSCTGFQGFGFRIYRANMIYRMGVCVCRVYRFCRACRFCGALQFIGNIGRSVEG